VQRRASTWSRGATLSGGAAGDAQTSKVKRGRAARRAASVLGLAV